MEKQELSHGERLQIDQTLKILDDTTYHVQNGTRLNILKELGGWAGYEMVQKHVHLAPEDLAEFAANARVEKCLQGKTILS